MSETFVDTSFVIAVVNHRDQYHEDAVKLANLYDGQPLVTTEAVVLEIGNALARNYKAEAVATIEDFLESDEVTVNGKSSPLLALERKRLANIDDPRCWGIHSSQRRSRRTYLSVGLARRNPTPPMTVMQYRDAFVLCSKLFFVMVTTERFELRREDRH